MSASTSLKAPTPAQSPKHPRGKPRAPINRSLLQAAGRDARRTAAAILEVLAGVRTPADAAAALAVSLPRYYLLETRALAGLAKACEPRPRGKVRSPQSELTSLRKECERLRREAARQQALARAAGRTVGLPAPEPPKVKPGRRKRTRRPTVRALSVAALLRADEAGPPPENASSPSGGSSDNR